MNRRTTSRAAVLLAALLAVPLAGCGDDGPDLAACKTALQGQVDDFADRVASGDLSDVPEGERPDECKGVSDSDLERLFGEVTAGS